MAYLPPVLNCARETGLSWRFIACLAIEVRFQNEAEISELTICDCSLCRKKNAVMTRVRSSPFRLLAGEDKLSRHKWNSRGAQHVICSDCGIYSFHRKRAQPDHYGINAACLDDLDVERLPVQETAGLDMALVRADAREEWRGPKVGDIDEARVKMRGG